MTQRENRSLKERAPRGETRVLQLDRLIVQRIERLEVELREVERKLQCVEAELREIEHVVG